MQVAVTVSGSQGTLRLAGRFDFNAHREFRSAAGELLHNTAVTRIDLNFADVEYLDSSGLAMLLWLRDQCKGSGRELSLVRCQGAVKQVLDVVNFGKLFSIS